MLKLQYFGYLMQTADSLEKSLMLGKIEGRRRRGCQSTRWLDGITDAINMNLGKLQEMMRGREAWCATVPGGAKSWTGLSDQPTKGLSCGTWDFHSSSQRMRSLTLVCGLYLPNKGSNPGFLSQELRGLLTAPPGKSQNTC